MRNHVEPLEDRMLLAVSAIYVAPLGVLTILGDNAGNTITVGRDATGNVRINDGAIRIFGGKPTSTNTSSIIILGSGGADHLRLDEANGTLPPSIMFGGSG